MASGVNIGFKAPQSPFLRSLGVTLSWRGFRRWRSAVAMPPSGPSPWLERPRTGFAQGLKAVGSSEESGYSIRAMQAEHAAKSHVRRGISSSSRQPTKNAV